MDRRAFFKTTWLGALLLGPQLLLVFTFFYWPTGAALFWAFSLERPWGGGNQFVGFDSFRAVFADSAYWGAVWHSVVFAVGSSVLAMSLALLFALFCDRQLRGY